MKKIYIAGCGGMLGEAFHKIFCDYELKCTDKDVNESWLSFLDFRDYGKYWEDVVRFNPDYLFHIGALTDLEYCELHAEETEEVNTQCVKYAVFIANELNIPILYISTAGIFDGKKDFYSDYDIPNPLNVYGRTKYLGEKFVIENANKYLVCRAGWMMGGGSKDKKFVSKIIKQLDVEKEIYVVNDRFGTPTYTYDFAKTVKELIERNYFGLYNCVCEGSASRVDIAREIIRLLKKGTYLNSVSSDYFVDYFVKRPVSEQLLNRNLEMRNIHTMRHWKVALKEYIDGRYS